MGRKRGAEEATVAADPMTKPVRVDLPPDVHKALRRKAAEEETSMASLARRIVAEYLGFGQKPQ